jgi:hypothetical protein
MKPYFWNTAAQERSLRRAGDPPSSTSWLTRPAVDRCLRREAIAAPLVEKGGAGPGDRPRGVASELPAFRFDQPEKVDVRQKAIPAISQGPSWAESARTGVARGRTGMCAKAAMSGRRSRRVRVHDEDRLARISQLEKSIGVGEIKFPRGNARFEPE